MAWVADYTDRIAPTALRAAGVVGVCRYVSRSSWKVIGQAEYNELIRAGFGVVLNFEDEAAGWLGGASAGRADAEYAVSAARALGYPAGSPIPSSADFDMSATQWNSAARAYATAYRDRLRQLGYRPGVYGPWDVLGWCKSVGYDWFWQAGMATAWSDGRNAHLWPGAYLWQRYPTTIAGASVDHNDILRRDWDGMALTAEEHNALINTNTWLANYLNKKGEPDYPVVEDIEAIRASVDALTRAVAALTAKVDALTPVVAGDLQVSGTLHVIGG
jgi:hypothetical protein